MSLIRSVLDYSSFIIPLLNTTSYKRVQAIQNIALKTIYRLPRLMHTHEVSKITNVITLKERADELNVKYFINSIIHENPLITDLVADYKNFKNKKRRYETILCKYYDELKEWIDFNNQAVVTVV